MCVCVCVCVNKEMPTNEGSDIICYGYDRVRFESHLKTMKTFKTSCKSENYGMTLVI